MGFTHSDSIEVRWIKGKGRGVFARQPIREGEVIEKVPVLVLPAEALENESGPTRLADYCFVWGRDSVALALGYGSLYNHSYQPNARYDDIGKQTKIFTALRDIQADEEITVNYNGSPEDRSKVDFDVLPSPPPRRRKQTVPTRSPRTPAAVQRSRRTSQQPGADALGTPPTRDFVNPPEPNRG